MRNRRGFTLIEMLVVAGLIMVLISLLLPILNGARQQMQSSKCSDNMRAIWAASLSYMQDNDGSLPFPVEIGETGSSWLCYWCPSAGVLDFTHGALFPYIADSIPAREDILNCPADAESARIISSATSVGRRNFSYSFNVLLRTNPKLVKIQNASNKIIIVEENWPNDASAFLSENDVNDVPATRHLGRCNMGMADGHVQSFTPVDLGFNIAASPPIANMAVTTSYTDITKP